MEPEDLDCSGTSSYILTATTGLPATLCPLQDGRGCLRLQPMCRCMYRCILAVHAMNRMDTQQACSSHASGNIP